MDKSILEKIETVLTEDEQNSLWGEIARGAELMRFNGTEEMVREIYGREDPIKYQWDGYLQEKYIKMLRSGMVFFTGFDNWYVQSAGKVIRDYYTNQRTCELKK